MSKYLNHFDAVDLSECHSEDSDKFLYDAQFMYKKLSDMYFSDNALKSVNFDGGQTFQIWWKKNNEISHLQV